MRYHSHMNVEGRKLSHDKLEEIRFQAVRAVQEGAITQGGGARPGSLRQPRLYLVGRVPCRGLGRVAREESDGSPEAAEWQTDPLALQYHHPEESSSTPAALCLVDAAPDAHPHYAEVWREVKSRLHRPVVGAAGTHLREALVPGLSVEPGFGRGLVRAEYPKIHAQEKRVGAEIFFEDESGVRSDFHSGTTWAPKGETPIVRVTGARFSLSMISAISPRGTIRFMVVRGGVGAQVFITFLKRLLAGMDHPIFLIVDGHPAHRAKSVQRFVDSLDGRLKIFFLRPYSPDLNPDKLVWNDVKNHGVAHTVANGPGDLLRALVGRLGYLQKTPRLVQSFLRVPETRYAAM